MINNNNKLSRSLVAMAVSGLLWANSPAHAADSASSGFLTGQIQSSQGQGLGNVTIVIKNTETGLTRTVESNENGEYRFPLLPRGNYDITATGAGFQDTILERVKVNPGNKTQLTITMHSADMERIEVRGAQIAQIDTTSSEAVLIVDQEFLSKVPVSRDLTSVALLAPGTTKGDDGFGNLASFGGASVAENAYYVNGMNITNFRNGLGGSTVPFEMYETFEVKTGGYSAEFGRSTGGVVNATTKRGTNEFHWGASAWVEPDSLREDAPDTKRTDPAAILEADSEFFRVNNRDKTSENNYNLWASGALIQDKFFYYGLVNYQTRDQDWVSNTTANFYSSESDSVFLGLKLDYYITENHILELTAFDDSRDNDVSKYNYDPDTDTNTDYRGDYVEERGGKTWSLKYTGILDDDFTMSAMAGINKADRSNLNVGSSAFGDSPRIYERRTGTNLGNWALVSPTLQDDERKVFRVDFDWYLDDHTLRFGIDYEELEAYENTQRSGGVSYRYQDCDLDQLALGNAVNCDRVRKEIYQNEGGFKTESYAYYITDTWQVTDDLTLTLGLRNEGFENFNKEDEAFVKILNQWAPRVGAAWDIDGSGDHKLFANWGRYYLPVATNTNIRLAGDELYTRQYFEILSVDPVTQIPTLGEPITNLFVLANGEIKDTRSLVNQDLDPMYQDEWILGYQGMITDEWAFGVKATYRDLKTSLEDIAIDAALNNYAEANGFDDFHAGGFDHYILTNPGSDMVVFIDLDGDGEPERVELTADELGYPEAERSYLAFDFTFNRIWDEKWMLDLVYTWAHSWGNNEGFVRSDNEQDDAGLTTNFDQPGLTDGASGNLPNDRRHTVKIFGAYALTEDLTVGVNMRWQSGRPKNAFGFHPTDVFASYYGADSFAQNGVIVPRGSLGETSSVFNLDISMNYNVEINDVPVDFRLDIFNLLDRDTVTETYEIAERYLDTDPDTGIDLGEAEPDYGLASDYQTPRYVRLSASIKF